MYWLRRRTDFLSLPDGATGAIGAEELRRNRDSARSSQISVSNSVVLLKGRSSVAVVVREGFNGDSI